MQFTIFVPVTDETFYSPEAAVVLEELTQGKMLQAQVVGKAEDGIPYIHIYQISGPSQVFLVDIGLILDIIGLFAC